MKNRAPIAHDLTVLSLAPLIAAVAIAGCGQGQPTIAPAPEGGSAPVATESTSSAETGWAMEEKNSPVQGKELVAFFMTGAGTTADPSRQITIVCLERTQVLTLELLVQTEPTEAKLNIETFTGQFMGDPVTSSVPVGMAVTATHPTPFNAAELFYVEDYINVAKLRSNRNNNTNEAGNLVAQLPIAVELESNVGKMLFEIPRNDVVVGVANRCVPDAALVAARAQAEQAVTAAEAARDAALAELQTDAVAAQNASNEVSKEYLAIANDARSAISGNQGRPGDQAASDAARERVAAAKAASDEADQRVSRAKAALKAEQERMDGLVSEAKDAYREILSRNSVEPN